MTINELTIAETIPDGLWPVMLTPFLEDRRIDYYALDRLIEFYLESGAAGLFAVCQSSEMFDLDADERVALAEHVVTRASGQVPVVASGTFGVTNQELAASVRRMAATGVAAVVCVTGMLADEGEGEDAWRSRVERLLHDTGDIPLGIYECPQPYHRVLTAATLKWTASAGRFLFLKETSCQLRLIAAKIEATRGSGQKIFNANAATLLGSLEQGVHGFCGISANYVPELWTWLCRNWQAEPATAARLQEFLRDAEEIFARQYPATAKHFLASRGIPMSPACRIETGRPSSDTLGTLESLRVKSEGWRRELGLG